MNTEQRDPIFESLDRLALLADTDHVGDRMPDIHRRVRETRRRKSVGVVAAAAVLAVGGLGVWQALPGDKRAEPPVTPPPAGPSQEITITAEGRGNNLTISFTVTGESTAYSDPETGEPVDYAGPQSTEVLVDGEYASGSDGGSISCDPGGALTPYTLEFFDKEPLVVPVSSAGEHTVVVKAPYCADGELVANTEKVVVTTGEGGFATADRLTADLDADGTDEAIRVLVPRDLEADKATVEVAWGTGETTRADTLPFTTAWGLQDPVDLDGDGDLELVVHGGGGEYSEYRVFQADPGALDAVSAIDASGQESPLLGGADPAAWRVAVTADGVFSYLLTDPEATDFPATAEVRAWTLDAATLTESADAVTRCVEFQPVFVLGPC